MTEKETTGKPVCGQCPNEQEMLTALNSAAKALIESGWTATGISNHVSQTFRQRKDHSRRNSDILKRYLSGERFSALAVDYSLSDNSVRGLADRTLKKLLKSAEVDPLQQQALRHKGLIRASKARKNPGYWLSLLNPAE